MVKKSGKLFLFLLSLCFCLTTTVVSASSGNDKTTRLIQFKDVAVKAKLLSKDRFLPSGKNLPNVLKEIGYDQWRGIRYRPDRSLWAQESFSVQFFHPGFLFKDPVQVHYVDQDGTYRVSFTSELFEYEDSALKGSLLDDNGFAGFRIHYPLNTSEYADELVAFLGASYFRAVGRGLAYGLSARGLAVNTAEDVGEEFPVFREFWIVRPKPGDKQITFYALLDSASVTGAYEFTVFVGEETRMKVNSMLFMRQHIQKLGVAPLTSMFAYGENSGFDGSKDFRPEVHDSDGFLVNAATGEWIWHPLVNPPRLSINSFGGALPLGFGLLQRDINFDHYQDLEAHYDRRPSVWVSPLGDWGKGHLELVQIPTENEYNDNIVSYWVPERTFERGDSVRYAYTLSWHSAWRRRSLQGFVDATRIVRKADGELFVVDFSGDVFKDELAGKTLVPDVWVSQGARIVSVQLIKHAVIGGWRLVFHVQQDNAGFMDRFLPDQKRAIELRALLKCEGSAVTETWSYTHFP